MSLVRDRVAGVYGDVVFWRSEHLAELGLPHGFLTRHGGVSEGPLASMDMAQDEARNLPLVLSALEMRGRKTALVRQVHGACCLASDEVCQADERPEADALWSENPSHALVIRIADCVPVLLASQDGKSVAAVHAGWRGVVGGAVESAVNKMGGAKLAAIGPCISCPHFEVGPEVAQAFLQADLAQCVQPGEADKSYVDMARAVWIQLQRLGVLQVDWQQQDETRDRLCTYANEQDFYSYRRDQTHRGWSITGRHAALIGARGG